MTDSHIRNTIKDCSKFKVTGLKHGNDGTVIIKCADIVGTEGSLNEATQLLGNDYTVSRPKRKLPRLKIINIHERLTKEQIYECIIKQNPCINDQSELKVLHISEHKSTSDVTIHTAYIEVKGSCFKEIVSVGYLNIGWNRCRVFEDVKVMRCYKCSGFNHKMESCSKPDPSCAKCADQHFTKDCKSESNKCVNCIFAVNSLKLEDINIMHPSWDRECPSYGRVLKLAQSKIAYNNE